MIFFVVFNLVSNLSFIVGGEIKKIFHKLRLKYFKWKFERLTKTIKKREEQKALTRQSIITDIEEQKQIDLEEKKEPSEQESFPI